MRKPVCFVCGKEADHQIGETYVCLRCAREDVTPPPGAKDIVRELDDICGCRERTVRQETRYAHTYGISANDAAGRWLREHDPDLTAAVASLQSLKGAYGLSLPPTW